MHPEVLAQMNGGVDWVYQFVNNLTNLTTANGGVLTQFGLTLLSFIAFMMLINMVVHWSTSTMTLSWHPETINLGDLVRFMLRLLFCALLISYWVNPIPGASFGFNHLFSYIAQQIVIVIDQQSLRDLTQLFNEASAKTGPPSLLAPVEILCYFFVEGILGIASAVLFVINISSFIFYAVTALFGPLFIPLYMTNSLRGKFFTFIETLLSFAMIRAVASAFIFVWSGFITTFIHQTFNGDYSIAMWLGNLIPVIMVFAAFIINLLFIPSITQTIFGGGAAATMSAQNLATNIAVRKFGAVRRTAPKGP